MPRLVVRRYRNVDELEGGIGVTEGDNRDIDVGRLSDGLVIYPWVGDDDDPRLFEGASDVVGEISGSETASNGLCSGISSIFQDGTVPVWSGGDHADVVGIFDGCNYASSENELLPSLSNVEDVNTIWASLPDIRLHAFIAVFGADVALRRKQHLNVLLRGGEN